jgi:hypothetical protein
VNPRAAAHVLALHDVDGATVIPANVAQIAGERCRCCPGGRVLVDATKGERVAGVEQARAFGEHQKDSHQAFAHHQLTAAGEVIAHVFQGVATVQRQH